MKLLDVISISNSYSNSGLLFTVFDQEKYEMLEIYLGKLCSRN